MYCISGNVIEILQRRRDALMQLLHPLMHPTEEINLKPSDEECLLPFAIGEETLVPFTVAGD